MELVADAERQLGLWTYYIDQIKEDIDQLKKD